MSFRKVFRNSLSWNAGGDLPTDPGSVPGEDISDYVYEQTDSSGFTVTWLNGPALKPSDTPTSPATKWWHAAFEVEAPVGTVLTFRRRARDTAGDWSNWQDHLDTGRLSVTVTATNPAAAAGAGRQTKMSLAIAIGV